MMLHLILYLTLPILILGKILDRCIYESNAYEHIYTTCRNDHGWARKSDMPLSLCLTNIDGVLYWHETDDPNNRQYYSTCRGCYLDGPQKNGYICTCKKKNQVEQLTYVNLEDGLWSDEDGRVGCWNYGSIFIDGLGPGIRGTAPKENGTVGDRGGDRRTTKALAFTG
ncbi:hypothetical protein EJ08DRAFT_252437 [Tothia fuscella]|uniref:Cyanovirin-N domain-containing protein n=1 Tax=Tothia fuscella TaxID=1048955 RepID=A0A9P4NR45_9PEZI|nr:hypothetical protein EJ08DRAFT_252437 [Tothia fuscella]